MVYQEGLFRCQLEGAHEGATRVVPCDLRLCYVARCSSCWQSWWDNRCRESGICVADLEIDIWVDCDELGILLAVCTPCLASCIPAMWTEGRLSVREVELLVLKEYFPPV